MTRRLTLAGVLALMAWTTAFGGEIDFREDFALAQDRAAVLKQLIPGTEDYYYYHALHYLQTEQFAKLEQQFTPWVQRHGETSRVWEIRTRLALTTYPKDQQKSLTYLRSRLNLHYPHARELLDAEPNFPTKIDPQQIARDAFINRANATWPNSLQGYEDSALDWLTASPLNPEHRRHLLSRLQRPDYPNLVKLIVDDLNHPNSGGFGSFNIHRLLLLSQLEELLKLKPELLNQQPFVTAYLTKLQPGADENWRRDPAPLTAYLDRLETFAKRLQPAHNSLKAYVLYHQLTLARQQGKFDKERFHQYLALPRHVAYASKRMLESEDIRRFPANFGQNYDGALLLPPIGNDESLVRSYLIHFLTDAKDIKEFEPFVNDVYLKHLLAEVKILAGLGEVEQWASMLPPEQFQALKERVDIDFAFINKTEYTADQPVQLELQLKNVNTLIVKVFEINAKSVYRSQQREVDTDINLDGLVANSEKTYTYTQPPLRRTTQRFEFPQLNKPGLYVIDFIGNGRSSRALIRKGQLKPLVRTTAAGQLVTILDEKGAPVPGAVLWLGGHEYTADKEGQTIVPFSTNPGRTPIVLTAKVAGQEYSSLTHLDHQAENYSLAAGFYVDRESLHKRKTAKLLVRPGLTVNGVPAAVKNLEEVKLTITSTDLDGISSSQEINDFKLFEDRESTHEFQVPDRLAALNFHLTAKIKKLSAGGQKTDLAAADSFTLNGIDRTEKIEDLHLVQTDGKYVLELRGKTGEARPSRPVTVTCKHRDFQQPYSVTLKTDPQGRIALGALTDIRIVTAQGPEGTAHSWTLVNDNNVFPGALHGKVGDTLSVPYLPQRPAGAASGKEELSRKEVSLLELRGETFTVDRFEHLRVADGLLLLEKLPAGDFDLWLKSTGVRMRVRIAAGEQRGRFVVGAVRNLETSPLAPIQIESVKTVAAPEKKEGDAKKDDKDPPGDKLVVQLRNISKFARVHVFATRIVPEYSAFDRLANVRDSGLSYNVPGFAESVYLTGRNIGDEYRYIIDRKYAKKYPGNSLERPSLLLNPWAVRETQTGEQVAQGGDSFGARRKLMEASGGSAMTGKPSDTGPAQGFADLDFLALGSAVLVNLTPNDKGVLEIPRAALGPHQHIHIVAVDPVHTVYRGFSLPEQRAEFADLRLINGLNPQAHFTQQKRISVVPAGEAFTLHDITTSKFEAYDSLPRVFNLYATLNRDPKLVEFAFILRWPKLKDEEKRELYSKYASHELNFFLFKKDPAFFKAVIVQYLQNKKDKTFFDHFLSEDDLRSFLDPWRYEQLNVVERILLSRRIQGEQQFTSRLVKDQFQLLPPNIDNFLRLFDTAVQRSSLDTEDALGLMDALERAPQNLNGAVPMLRGALAFDPQSAASDAPVGGPGGGGNYAGRPAVTAAAPAAPPAEAAGKEMYRAERQLKQMEKAQEELSKSKMAKDGKADRWAGKKRDQMGDKALADADEKEELTEEFFFDADGTVAEARESLRALYRKLEKTKEWAENNYHHLTIDQQNGNLITVNAAWDDFAKHDPAKPFYTRNMAEASRNFPEMMLALAALDLPFESPKHETKFDGAQMTLVPGGPLVVFHEEIRPSAAPEAGSKVLVSQNFYRHNDRYRMENGEQYDKFIADEFVVHVVYGCQTVITNPTSTRQKLNVLLQIPVGAIPVLNSRPTKTVHLTLEPYHTQTLEYHFYFPAAGKFPHFPVHVARNETLIAAATPVELNVVDKPTKLDTESWEYLSQHGTEEQVLAYLDGHSVSAINLERIAWRMKDAKFFDAVIGRLTKRHVYQHTLWSYALLHNVVPAAREFLKHADPIVNEIGGRIETTLLTIDPVERRTFEHLEYKPLVNARTHALGKRRKIVNDRFFDQYLRFLRELSYQPQLTNEDLLGVTYYLLLQDRVEESLATFARVNAEEIHTQLQIDYCTAYLAFFTEDFAKARAIAAKHANHPVDRWRNTFTAITAQLDEAEGKGVTTPDQENQAQQQTQLASTEPSFDFVVEARRIQAEYQNLKKVRINYYEMDVELLFSRNPFVQQFQGKFTSIKPNLTQEIELAADQKTIAIPLPENLQGKNVIVEVEGAGQAKTQAYYANSLAIQTIENYGQVKVTHQKTGKPISKAYVKVYSKTDGGEVKFYKDGYTDVRGRFDYASLSTDDLETAKRFSILVMSDEFGATVREADPPQR